jgi:hypothetical protein
MVYDIWTATYYGGALLILNHHQLALLLSGTRILLLFSNIS